MEQITPNVLLLLDLQHIAHHVTMFVNEQLKAAERMHLNWRGVKHELCTLTFSAYKKHCLLIDIV